MLLADWVEAARRQKVKKPSGRAGARSDGTTRHEKARPPRSGWYQVEGLERRLFLSTAIAAFGAQRTFGAGTHPGFVAVADMNADGTPDLVVANNGSSSVGVLLGNGNGTFQAQHTFAAGSQPASIALSDVNGDGTRDLVVANGFGSSTVSVLLGNGNGTFQAQQTFATGDARPGGSEPVSLAVADVNADGRLDLALANDNSKSVSVLLGNGDGTFQAQRTFAIGFNPFSIAVSDINGDGRLDLVVANLNADSSSFTVSVLVGNGNGTFQARQTFATGQNPNSVAVADVNGDGRPDLLVSNESDNTVSVLLGNSGAPGASFQSQRTFATGSRPYSVVVADVNGDGRPDLLVANFSNNTVGVLLGTGTGAFQAQKTFATGSSPIFVAAADVNGDGRPDLMVANFYSNNVGVLLGDVPPVVLSIDRSTPPGPFTSSSSVSYTVTFSEPVTGVDASDFAVAPGGVTATTPVVVGGSAAVYTVTINGISGTGTLGLELLDDGSIKNAAGNPLQGPFAPQQTYATGNPNMRARAIASSDVNGDGIPDLIVAAGGSSPGIVSVLLGNGNGTLRPQQTFAAGNTPYGVVAADVNGDGMPDLVVNDANGSAVGILLGNGDGTFQARQTFAVGSIPIFVAVADVNGDGRPDVVAANYFSNTVSVLLGNGDGTFQTQQTFATGTYPGSYPRCVAVSDVNGDGVPDLIVANAGRNTVDVLIGNGDGTFQAQQTFATGSYPRSIAVGDVNGDGTPDVVAANYFSNIVSLLLGNGNGTFQAQHTFAVGGYPDAIALSDVNGDGKLDVVVTNRQSGNVGVLLGNGNGAFQPQRTFSTGSNPQSVVVADLNVDGRPDLAVANLYSTTSVLLADSNANFTGPFYTIVPLLDTITGTADIDQITLVQDPDHAHIDWTLGATTAQLLINDPNGLTIIGIDSNDVITLDYSNGNPLPDLLNLDGTFTINGLSDTNPLDNQTWNLNRSTVFITYASSNPLALIQGYIQNGYDNGAWTGTPTVSTGVITSAAAQSNPNHNTAIGYVDSADGTGYNEIPNSVELKYTLYGDTNLDGSVAFLDFSSLAANYNVNSTFNWDQGSFDYSGSVNFGSFSLLAANYNTTLGNQSAPAFAAPSAAQATSPAGPSATAAGSAATPPASSSLHRKRSHHLTIPVKKHQKRIPANGPHGGD